MALHGAACLSISEAATVDAAIRSAHRLRGAEDSQAVARVGEEASGLGLPADDQAAAERRDEDQQETGAAAVAGGRLAEPAAEAAKTRTRPQREQLRGEASRVQEPRVVLGFHDG